MHIIQMKIENYRTFRNVDLVFHDSVNYIVGPHRIGKTNFLMLLGDLCDRHRFQEDDFLDPKKPIRVQISFHLERKQTLLFKGMPFDDTGTVFHLEIVQRVDEISPHVYHAQTGEEVPLEWLRLIRYLQHTPSRLSRNGLSESERNRLEVVLQQVFGDEENRIAHALKEMAEQAGVEFDEKEMVGDTVRSWLAYLSREEIGNRVIDQSFQTVLLAGIQLLIELMITKESQAILWEDNLIIDERGRRFLPLVISIDEPEIHMHPYLQRSLLNFYHAILNNENPLIKDIFSRSLQIDGIEGQLFIVTNSTDCLLDDYRNIIRLYRNENNEVSAACGGEFCFEPDVEKHLIMHFPEVKEALYARAVLIVEGETEYGAFKGFAEKMKIDFDFLGICLVNARGESSIGKIAKLFERFHLGVVMLYDRDVKEKVHARRNIFFTDEVCFEMDIVMQCINQRRVQLLTDMIRKMEGRDGYVTREMARRASGKWNPFASAHITSRKLKNISGRDTNGLIFYHFAWLYSNKGVIVGRMLSRFLPRELIPPAFQRAIEMVAKIAQ